MHLSIFFRVSLAVLAMTTAVQAGAEAPEQIYKPGPHEGHSHLEYNGQIGETRHAARPHAVELFHGVSDGLALGIAVESEAEDSHFKVEKIAIGALIDLTREDAPIHAAMLVMAGVTTDGNFPQLDTRLIVEHESGPWTALGNVYWRRIDAHEQGTSLGYAATLHHKIADHVSVGAEVSGQAARLSGYSHGFDAAQYAGPSAIVSWDVAGGKELEIGVKYLRRIDSGSTYRDTVRMAFGFAF